MNAVPFNTLIGKTLTSITVAEDKTEILINTSEGEVFKLEHIQDCCEKVYIESIDGPLDILFNTPITIAEETTNEDNPPEFHDDSFTWTFYRLGTIKGIVVIRWYGESNGYYSEAVDLIQYSNL